MFCLNIFCITLNIQFCHSIWIFTIISGKNFGKCKQMSDETRSKIVAKYESGKKNHMLSAMN